MVADVNSGVIFSLLPANVLMLSLTMYTMEHSDFDVGVLGMDMIALFNAMLWPAFFCYFGNLAADGVSAIGLVAYDLNWFEHPVEMQKFLILTIARSNKRAEFSGLQLIPCSMEMFGKVNHFKTIH